MSGITGDKAGSGRDPKVNPKVGDALRKCGRNRYVTAVLLGAKRKTIFVFWKENEGGEITLKSWRRWAKNAEVIHAE